MVSAELKTALEREARRRNASLSAILRQAARAWLMKTNAARNDKEEQRRLYQDAEKFIGAISGENSLRSGNVSRIIRQRLRAKHRG